MNRHCLIVAALSAVITFGANAQTPVGTSFTYQGVLKSGGSAYNGAADVQFRLYDTASGGIAIGGTLSYSALAISDGLITASLNFGSTAFDGNDRWLEIAVRAPAGAGSFTTLTPRQKLAAAPYALTALNALNALIAGAQPNQVTFNNTANAFTGSSLAIDGSTLNVDATNHRVGIGTATPSTALQVVASGTGAPIARVYNGSDLPSSISLDTNYRQWSIGQNQPPDGGQLDEFFIYDASAAATRLAITTAGNVGIGTNNPTAKLDVNGGVTATSFAMPATTRRLSIPCTAFDAVVNDGSMSMDKRPYFVNGTVAGQAIMLTAPVNLPDGAVMTSLSADVLDADGTQNITVRLTRFTPTPPMEFLTLMSTSGSSASTQTLIDNTIDFPVVNNATYAYSVEATFTTPAGVVHNLRVYRVVITYTITSPLP